MMRKPLSCIAIKRVVSVAVKAVAVGKLEVTRITGRGTYDPVEDSWTRGELSYRGRGVFGSFQAELVDGNKILATDVKLLVLQAELLVPQDAESAAAERIAPKVDDTIAGMKVMSVSKDPADVSWTIQLRKV